MQSTPVRQMETKPTPRTTRADVMTASQVADLLGVPQSTVQDWARRAAIPSRERGRRRLFLRFEVETWLVAQDRALDG
jgi:excisionase family DNA binding protein